MTDDLLPLPDSGTSEDIYWADGRLRVWTGNTDDQPLAFTAAEALRLRDWLVEHSEALDQRAQAAEAAEWRRKVAALLIGPYGHCLDGKWLSVYVYSRDVNTSRAAVAAVAAAAGTQVTTKAITDDHTRDSITVGGVDLACVYTTAPDEAAS